MDETNRNPDRWLKVAQSQEEEQTPHRGSLKIFFGYAAGVGKTFAMLKAARAARKRGVDVVVGYVEPHDRPATAALLEGLEALPFLTCEHNGIQLREFDLDAALARKPQLILLDELAHTNADCCRHAKRYKDVRELLKAGIDVYSTVNVQHLESLHDKVAAITGVRVRERIPDSVFREADQVELVDIEPDDLLERLKAGKIYNSEQAHKALENFFTPKNLTALREIALRCCADRMNALVEKARVKSGEFPSDEHVLVGLSSSPSNAKLVRTAAQMAQAFRGSLTALLVKTPAFEEMGEEDRKRLEANMDLARRLGASIEVVHGDDIPYQLAEFARLSGVTKLVVGRSQPPHRFLRSIPGFRKPSLTDRLIALSPNLDLYIIPDHNASKGGYRRHTQVESRVFEPLSLLKAVGVLLASLLLSLLFDHLGFSEANLVTVFVLGVVLTSALTANRLYSVGSALLSVLLFNFFFTDPRYTFFAYDKNYPVTFLIMFAAALVSGTIAAKLRLSARQSARAAFRTQVLFDTNQLLQQAGSREEIAAATARQLVKLLNRDVVFYLPEGEKLAEPLFYEASPASDRSAALTENEQAVAAWVYKNNTRAGATTQTLPNARCLYLAVRVNETVYGVVGIVLHGERLEAFESSILLSMLGECGMALESECHAREKEEAAVLAKNEQLRANLLRAISHDLRTPLTSISGNASNLLANEERFDEATRRLLYQDIHEDALWLINLVENLLSVTRLEEGRLLLHFTPELLEEAIEEALRHVSREASKRVILVEQEDELLLARMDAKLMVQVLINLIDNAIKYTPEGSHITIATSREGDRAVVTVADDGPGIADEMKPFVFDMFYSGSNRIADSRRSLGLGLSLCRSIIRAHGGEITVGDNRPHGAVFRFTLPAEEVPVSE